ncbi:hypothetical protein ABK040_002496 [Willaertia magna]
MNLSENTLNQIKELWGFSNPLTCKLIKQSENHTFLIEEEENNNENNKFILRLTPNDHRELSALQSEINYITLIHQFITKNYSNNNGNSNNINTLHICTPIPLKSAVNHMNQEINQKEEEEYIAIINQPYGETTTLNNNENVKFYYAVLFNHAKGSGVLDKWCGLTNSKIIKALGHALGQLHVAISQRCNLSEEEWKLRVANHVPLCEETHGGATKIERIEKRANEGHEPSQFLLQIWNSKLKTFLEQTCGDKSNRMTFGVNHGDLNISNFFAEFLNNNENSNLPNIYVFDFDQIQHNFFGFDIGVILQSVKFFEDDGLGIGKIEGFNPEQYRKDFLDAYKESNPNLVKEGHLSEEMLEGFILYREFYHAGVAVDILFQSQNGKEFEAAIIGFCEIVVKRLRNKFGN